MQSWIWLVLMAVLLVAELLTVGLTTIWFAAGALVAYLSSLVGANLVVQVILFLVVSIVLFALTRPLLVDKLNKSRAKTNIDSLIGKKAKVTEEIDPLEETGTAFLEGKLWSARSADGRKIEAETIAEVVAVEGVKLILKEADDEKTQPETES